MNAESLIMSWAEATLELDDLKMVLVRMNPDRAKQLLPFKRNIRPDNNHHEIKEDMNRGHFQDRANSHMLLSEAGFVIDGGHRLEALARANSGTEVIQEFRLGGTSKDLVVTDNRRGRTLNQRIQEGNVVGTVLRGLLKYGAGDKNKKKLGTFKALALKEYYGESLKDVADKLQTRRFGIERSVLIRAHKCSKDSDRAKVMKLADALEGNNNTLRELSEDQFDIVTRLREYCRVTVRNSEAVRREIAEKLEYATHKFIGDKPMINLCRQTKTKWPVPISYIEELADEFDEDELEKIFGNNSDDDKGNQG